MKTVLACRKLYRHFTAGPSEVRVLEGLDLSVQAAQVVAILGPSGSGKSTLLHLLAGLDRPSAGDVFWEETRVTSLPQNELASRRAGLLGLVFQHHYLLEDLSVLDNVTIAGRIRGALHRARGLELLASVGLEARATSYPKTLSGGERQRVAVARALYGKPAVILADEPTGSLDRHNARVVYELLVHLARQEGSAVVMVTHDEGLVEEVDARYHLIDGRLEADAAPVPGR